MNKENYHKMGGSVIDLKSRARGNITPLPTMLSVSQRRYPAQVAAFVFAPASTPPFEKYESSTFLTRSQTVFSRIIAALLIPLMLVAPVANVYADELASGVPQSSDATVLPDTSLYAVSGEVVSSDAVTMAPTTEPPLTPLPSETSDETVPSNLEGIPENVGDASETDVPASATEELGEEIENGGGGFGGGSTSDGETSTTTDSTLQSDGVAISTQTADTLAESDPPVLATITEEIVDENAPTEGEDPPIPMKTSEEIAADEVLRTERLRNELRREVEQEFLRGCISFEASGYYCLNDGARNAAPAETVKVITTIESQQGEGGDKEIFVIRNGVRTVLTQNEWDDAFPTQDVSGEQFVWQGMKGGRWQIFVGTLTASGTPTVTQLTDSRESNFNPKIDGDHVVWQGWADENWEIFIATKRNINSHFAGEHLPEGNALLNVGPEWAVERLTTNSEHDMFPSLHGDIVTWQSHVGDNWLVNAYSILQKKQTQLSSPGTKGENPRFSITWEERDRDGRARLVGYDLATGEKTDITKASLLIPETPYQRPETIPLTHPDPATLPPPQTMGSSTQSRGDDDSNDNPLLP